ncbi:Oxidored-FMN domain-containing protein [Mycena indigotica]|uniref:Oxidored-FMN domain-containing protein n=1 Tax=Mycena indigotica TaxID=2126181 RepID=A0A8H6VWN8_9AGAR|nr:Oxidored-FMN domain-containing protein [Mycena indigotica]KAF7296789.1 Oxidored-FMN domain-containing protein [Mycena indigotica]
MSALLTPLKVGSVTISNRVGMSALTRSRATGAVANDVMRDYYVQRAEGGAGLIVSEGILVTRQGTEWPAAPGLWDASQVEGWKKIVDGVHAAGSKIYAQLWHVGRLAHPDAPEQKAAGEPVYGPSAIAARGGKFRFLADEPGYVVPTELADPKTVVALFKKAAEHAKAAGFDGVEIHGANGYIVHQFLDNTANKRTDAYGGSPANRSRFALEVIAACQEVYSENVAIKLAPTGGYNDVGMPLDETVATFGHLLEQIDKLPTPLSYVVLTKYNPVLDNEVDGKLRATQFDVVETFKSYFASGRTHFFLNSGLQVADAETYVGDGNNAVKAVFFGVNWLIHPDLAKRIQHGKPLDNEPDWMHLYGAEGTDPAIGYTDYKAAVY